MTGIKRAGTALLALVLAGGAVGSLMAQIPGMPLFTNPRYGTGLRIHADAGKPTEADPAAGDLTVLQAGVSLAIGPVGLNANVGTTKATADAAQGCIATPTLDCVNSTATVSALAQLRVWGGGRNNLSLSVFGGGSLTLDAGDAIANAGGGGLAPNKELHIPVGASLGLHIPLGLGSLNLWGAPRYNLTRFVNCSTTCPTNPKSTFGWAVGADLPIFRVFSIRAAYDSHQEKAGTTTTTVNVIGVGASFGIGGMR